MWTKQKANQLQNKSSRGFTIVELLVVIVVIGILAAIVIVTYQGASRRAEDAATKSNVQNFVKQAKSYQVENGDALPGYDFAAANVASSNGGRYYSTGDFATDVSYNSAEKAVSAASLKSMHNVDIKGRVGYIAFAVNTNHNSNYYLGSVAIGLYKNKESVPKTNRIPTLNDSVIDVSGWYVMYAPYGSAEAVSVKDEKVVCSNGSTITSSISTWGQAFKQRTIRSPSLTNGKIGLSSASLSVRQVDLTCPGFNKITLFSLVQDTAYTNLDTSGHSAAYVLDVSKMLNYK